MNSVIVLAMTLSGMPESRCYEAIFLIFYLAVRPHLKIDLSSCSTVKIAVITRSHHAGVTLPAFRLLLPSAYNGPGAEAGPLICRGPLSEVGLRPTGVNSCCRCGHATLIGNQREIIQVDQAGVGGMHIQPPLKRCQTSLGQST